MALKAVVFDMDDTLYEEKQYVESGFRAVDNWVLEEYRISGFYEAASRLFHSGEKRQIFNKALEQLHIPYNDRLIEEMVDLYRSHKPDIRLSEDARWTLDHLSETARIGLISDGYLAAQEQKVSALNLQERFDSIVLTDRLGRHCWKPSPVPYEHASTELRIPHHQCVYIGDNVNKDFIAANRLGWTTVHINRKTGIYSEAVAQRDFHAQYQIDDLRKLPEIPDLQHMFRT